MLSQLFALGVVAATVSRTAAQDAVPDPMPESAIAEGAPFNGTSNPVFTWPGTEYQPPGPGKECEPYYNAEVANAVGSFPAIWEAATILAGDTNAEAKWAAIQPSVPDIAPKARIGIHLVYNLAYTT